MHSPYGLEIVERCAGCRRREPHAFCKLPESSLRALEALKYTTLYPRGALLFVEGQATRGVYILCSGRVKLSVLNRGEPRSLYLPYWLLATSPPRHVIRTCHVCRRFWAGNGE